jgi:hypothetical protein
MSEKPNPEGCSGLGTEQDAPPPGPAATLNVIRDQPFGAALEPALIDATNGRISDIHWFRTDWQRGGAMTGYATWTDDQRAQHPVVVKLPVPPAERWWHDHLQAFDDVSPKLYAHGETVGPYDMVWIVMERMAHGPLSTAWNGAAFDLLVEAAGRFYGAAATFPAKGSTNDKDWDAIYHRAREFVHHHDVRHEQRWNKALKKAHRKLKGWLKIWDDRPRDQWCHGDLHLGNAMTRAQPPHGPAVLLDFAECHLGHWVEDAVYLEHLFWARRERLGGRRLCSQIAKARKVAGLYVDADWPKWADVKRALIAMSTPAMLEHDGDPLHVEAALGVLEAQVGK